MFKPMLAPRSVSQAPLATSAYPAPGDPAIGNTGTGFPTGYGERNRTGYSTSPFSRFLATTLALRAACVRMNAGSVYAPPAIQRGGVLAGDAGLLPTYAYLGGVNGAKYRAPFRGVTYALTPVKEQSQTLLAQWAATPTGYAGDAPGDIQEVVHNAPPWRRQLARADSRGAFRSGIMSGLRI